MILAGVLNVCKEKREKTHGRKHTVSVMPHACVISVWSAKWLLREYYDYETSNCLLIHERASWRDFLFGCICAPYVLYMFSSYGNEIVCWINRFYFFFIQYSHSSESANAWTPWYRAFQWRITRKRMHVTQIIQLKLFRVWDNLFGRLFLINISVWNSHEKFIRIIYCLWSRWQQHIDADIYQPMVWIEDAKSFCSELPPYILDMS